MTTLGPHPAHGPVPGTMDEGDWLDAPVLLDRQTAVLELIAQAAPLSDVLTEILRSLEGLMPGASCSVLLLDRPTGRLHHGAAPSLPSSYVAAIDGLPVADGVGSCGTAAALNRPVLVPDVRLDPRWADFRDAAAAAGQQACWSTPIAGRDHRPVGTFAVYHRTPHTPTPREQRLVDRFTHLAAVAIGHAELVADRRARLEAETARRTAEELSRAKSQLLAAVGHEARTPIQAIVGFAELLGTIDLDEARRREALAHIGAAAGHVMDLLTDVLDVSRLEAGALPLQVAAVPVAEVVEEVLGLLSAKAAARSTILDQELPQDGPTTVLADRRRLRQVLLNLVENGVRHGRAGGAVTVAATRDAGQVVLTVRDDGPGIAPDLLDRLFTPFAPGGTQPLVGGDSVGLGLALSAGLVHAMGGELVVGRTGPGGTEMRVRLPGP
ncbi:GAF domain-containing sensor histidine kinase [Nocardioides sp.]|uniref:GAF domain-containing sensor histidine kinase n=1 Tax=Nocardioides sp. TaxID=35761 RepID=UPI002614C18B|nr:GAF domain-containing sensor histidine kinase [Nocardioides sp.]